MGGASAHLPIASALPAHCLYTACTASTASPDCLCTACTRPLSACINHMAVHPTAGRTNCLSLYTEAMHTGASCALGHQGGTQEIPGRYMYYCCRHHGHLWFRGADTVRSHTALCGVVIGLQTLLWEPPPACRWGAGGRDAAREGGERGCGQCHDGTVWAHLGWGHCRQLPLLGHWSDLRAKPGRRVASFKWPNNSRRVRHHVVVCGRICMECDRGSIGTLHFYRMNSRGLTP